MPLQYANLHICAKPLLLLAPSLSSLSLLYPHLLLLSYPSAPLTLPPSLQPPLLLLSEAAEIPFPVGQAKLNWRVYMNNRAVALIYLRVYA